MPVATHRAEQTTPNAPAAMTWVHGPSGHRVNARDKVSRSGSVAERNHPATTSPVEPDTNFNMASPVGAKASVSNGQAQVSSEAPSEAPVSGEAGRLEPLREAAALDDNATQLGEVTQQTRIEDVLLAQVSTATDGALEGGRGAAAGVGDSVPAASSAEAGASVLSGNAGLVALGVLGAAGLASHGGGSSSSTQTTTPATGLTVSLTGGLTAGPVVKSLHVTAYDRNGNKLGEADTDASGKYTLTIASSKVFNGGAVLLQVSDPAGGANDYRDEATGQLADITDLRAVVFVSAPTSGTSVTLPSVQITPLTTLAAELLAPLPTSTGSVWSLSSDKATGNAVQAANRQVGLLFGLSTTLDVAADVTQATPQTVISSDGSPVAATQSNAYGKALAVLSHAQDAALNATDPVPLTIQKLAASLNGTSNLTSSSTQALNFSSAVATQFSTAALTAASKGELTASDVGTIQTATAGGSSSGIAALNFKFTQAPTLSTLDPANALGQKVYTLYKGGTSNMVPEGGALYADNVGNQAVTYVLAGADKDAFEFVVNANPTTDNSQVLGWLKLKAPTDGTQPIQAQKNGGYTYHVDLKAVADPFNTPDNTADDISVTQSLSLKVQDETKPSLPNTPTVVLNTDTQASGGNLARVGGAKAAGNAFITVTDPDVASIPLGVKHHLTITLENTGNTLGAKGQVVKEWDAVGSPHTIALSAEELTTLGEGTIKVTTTDQAIDWAENTSALQTTTQQFVLDTTVASPTVAVADNKAASASSTPLSGDGFIRISGLEAGATWVYQIVNADTSSVVKAWSSTPLTVNSGASTDPVTYTAYTSGTTTLYRTDLNLSSLGSGNYSIEVRQTDSLLNASQPKSLAFQLNLEAPQGVDAQIDKFIVYKDTSTSPEPDNTTLLLGDHARVDVSGKIRGTPKAGEKIQYNLNAGNENSWVDIPASAIQSDGTFTLTDLTLPVGNGVIRISQTDNLGHRTLLSSRAFVNQDVNVLTPPRLQWLGAATLEDGTATSASSLRVKIDNPDGLSERAVVQYLLLDHQLGTTETVASDAWRATIDQPTASGTYYLYARQWDVMTGYASEVDVTSPLSIHYVKPETTTAITGLTLASVDGNGHVTSSALDEPAVLSNGKLAALTVVVELEAGLNEGSTLSMRWGNQLQHYTLTTDDVSSKKAYITWDKADLLKQPGNTTVQAWVTDLTGQVSAKTSQSWFVGDSSTTVPAILGWSTKTAESDDYAPDTDNTINAKESAFGVELSLQLPTYETGGTTPLTWANSSANGGKAFQLSLFSKTAAGDWTVFPIKSATFTAESLTDGVVHWVVSKDVWDGLSGARDWKVQITNFSQAPDAPLYITETGLSELLVDLAPPKSI